MTIGRNWWNHFDHSYSIYVKQTKKTHKQFFIFNTLVISLSRNFHRNQQKWLDSMPYMEYNQCVFSKTVEWKIHSFTIRLIYSWNSNESACCYSLWAPLTLSMKWAEKIDCRCSYQFTRNGSLVSGHCKIVMKRYHFHSHQVYVRLGDIRYVLFTLTRFYVCVFFV